jgi:hypothetical protein
MARVEDRFLGNTRDQRRLGAHGIAKRSVLDQLRRAKGKEFAIPPDLDQPRPALLHDNAIATRRSARFEPGVARSERRVPGERQLACRIEYPYPVIRSRVARRQEEGRLGKAEPLGQREHLRIAQPFPAMDHAERVALQRGRAEHVHQV